MEKLCSNFNVVLKVGNEEKEIECGRGTRQGDYLSPTLLMFVMQLVVEETIPALKKNNINLIMMNLLVM